MDTGAGLHRNVRTCARRFAGALLLVLVSAPSGLSAQGPDAKAVATAAAMRDKRLGAGDVDAAMQRDFRQSAVLVSTDHLADILA